MHQKLQHYLNHWHLSEPKLIATTATSHVYRVRVEGRYGVLKLLTQLGEADEANGAIALRAFGGQGAIRVMQFDSHAHLLEYVAGASLVPMVERGQDAQATHIIAQAIQHMHSATTYTPDHNLTPLSQWFRSLFRRAKQDTQAGQNTLYQCGAQVAQVLLDNPQDDCVLHGDIHHANVLHSAGRGWLAIDPKGLHGERTYDLANTLCNPIHMPDVVLNEERLLTNAAILAETNVIEVERVLAFTFSYACLSASWSEEDQQNPSLALGVAHLLEPHVRKYV